METMEQKMKIAKSVSRKVTGARILSRGAVDCTSNLTEDCG
jgi:hypothetical protein